MENHNLFEIAMSYKAVNAERNLKRLDFKQLLKDKIAELEYFRPMNGVYRRILKSGHLTLIN